MITVGGPNLFVLDLGENAVDACLLASRAVAAAEATRTVQGAGNDFRLVTVGTSEQERRAAELGVPALDHCCRLSDVSRMVAALRAERVTVTSSRLWLALGGRAARRTPGGSQLPQLASPRLTLAAWSVGGRPLGQYPPDATLQLTVLDTIRATAHTAAAAHRTRHVLRAGIDLKDRELAIGLVGAWPQEGLVPPCTLFSRVIGMVALGGFPVVGVADGSHEDVHHAATFVRTVEDQFELIAIDGPVEAGLGAFDGIVWLNPDAGGWVAAMQSLVSGMPVVTVESPTARAVAGLAGTLRQANPAMARMAIAPLETMASVGSRLMEVLGLVQLAPVHYAAAHQAQAHEGQVHGGQAQASIAVSAMSEGESGS